MFGLAEREFDIYNRPCTLEGRSNCLSRTGQWYPKAESCPLFAGDGLAHLVSVDSEPKVVRNLQDRCNSVCVCICVVASGRCPCVCMCCVHACNKKCRFARADCLPLLLRLEKDGCLRFAISHHLYADCGVLPRIRLFVSTVVSETTGPWAMQTESASGF